MPTSKYSTGLEGRRFGRWTVLVLSCSEEDRPRHFIYFWWCLCDCGNVREVEARTMHRGRSVSCGCYNREQTVAKHLKHGHNRPTQGGHSREYRSWSHIQQRTTNPKHNPSWHRYGGRGIAMCDGLHDFSTFLRLLGPRPDNHSIDRTNNEGHYSCGECEECVSKGWPFNLRWATPKQQSANRSVNLSDNHRGSRSPSLPVSTPVP